MRNATLLEQRTDNCKGLRTLNFITSPLSLCPQVLGTYCVLI